MASTADLVTNFINQTSQIFNDVSANLFLNTADLSYHYDNEFLYGGNIMTSLGNKCVFLNPQTMQIKCDRSV